MRDHFSRRAFLHTAALLGTSLEIPAAASGMYVALNGSLVGNKVSWPEFVHLAARVGYGGADFNLSAAQKYGLEPTQALFAETRLRAGFAGLPVSVVRDDDTFRSALAGLDAAAKFASDAGCHRMTVVVPAASATPKPEFRRILKDRLTEAARVLAAHDIRLGLEFLGPLQFRQKPLTEFIWRMNEMLQLAVECGPNVGLTLDAWHWHHARATASDIVAAGKSRIVNIHVSDAPNISPIEVRDDHRLMPGEGVIRLVDFFRALQQIGYEDGISPEPLGRIPPEMSAEAGARLGLDTTTAVMRKAGVWP